MINIDDPKNRDKYLSYFKLLLSCPGWHLLIELANQTIEGIKERLEDGMDGETYEDVKVLRANLKSYQSFINTPKLMIKRLGPVEESKTDSDDPYGV